MTIRKAPFPFSRPRRLRQSDWMRNLVSETQLSPSDLIQPIFVMDGTNKKEPIASMPNVYRYSLDLLPEFVNEIANLDIPAVALFPYTDPSLKAPDCQEAFNPENLVNKATRILKNQVPDIGIMLDVALDPYNSDGHDGLVRDGVILNDETLIALEKQALVQAEAGADILGPSDMMDGRVGVIRQALEANDFPNTAIMAYSAKYASAFYGPFRDAVGASGALKGDKKTYQLDYRNSDEAIQMIVRDLEEGADMVMVKPGQAYLDICQRVTSETGAPCFAYQVSGEYAMIEAAAANGWVEREKIILESAMAFKRAGCRGILTYHAVDIVKMLQDPLI